MIKRLFVLGAVISLTAGATFAYFSATASSSDNTVEAGTLKFGSPVSDDFSVTNAAPGETYTGDHNPYDVGNKGSIDANHIELSVSNTVTDTNSDADPDMDRMLQIDKMTYGTLNIKTNIEGNPTATSFASGGYIVSIEGGAAFSTLLSDGVMNLDSWEGKVIEIADDPATDGVPTGLAAGDTVNFDIDLKFNPDATDVYQGDSVNTTLTFTLNQDASQ
jgi:predicted ribosomally synthesized peptide with SipW-like signal peptide